MVAKKWYIGDDYSLGDSTEDGGRESVLSDGQNGTSNGKRKVPKVFSKEAITKFRTWLFSNLQVRKKFARIKISKEFHKNYIKIVKVLFFHHLSK